MEKALKVQRGKEQLVSASEIQREFRGKNPYGVSFICPLCRQPLFPAAMSLGNKQSPHFRHERNNERAHECVLYANRYGYFTTYQRVPMPMFIRRSRFGNGTFIVEGGFRSLDQHDLHTLEREGTMLRIAQKSYKITSQRFGAGLTKLPFEEISLKCGSLVWLVGSSSLDLNSTWGCPENARHAMVFTRDADTEQGKRLKVGDTIPFETDLFLLAPERESCRIRSAFTNSRQVGAVGKRMLMSSLAVFEARLTKDDDRWKQSKNYLEECGFEVDDPGDTPELIWPPSLTSGGDLLPLFERARCVFAADMRSSVDNRLYIHTDADTAERVRTVPLRSVDSGESGFAILKNTAKLSFVTTRNWVFSSAVLLHPSDFAVDEWLHDLDLEPRVSFDSGCWILELACPGEVLCYEKDKGIQVKSTKSDTPLLFKEGSLDILQVRRKLGASLDYLVTFEKAFESRPLPEEDSAGMAMGKYSLAPGMSTGIAFALARRNGRLRYQGGADMQRALHRKARG